MCRSNTDEGLSKTSELLKSYRNIDTDMAINVYAPFCLSTAKSKFSLLSLVAD